MHKASWENLDDFLALDTKGGFATPALFYYQRGGTGSASVIFDEPYFNAQAGEYELENSQPRITGKQADLAQLRRGDEVEIGGVRYDVLSGPLNDGTGLAMVELAGQNA